MPRHNEEEIQLGIALFKKCCYETVRSEYQGKPTVWSGKVCEGGGDYIRYNLNEDAMTPQYVAGKLGLKRIIQPANAAYNEAAIQATKEFLEKP